MFDPLSAMEKDEYRCNKHENLEDLLEFYKENASDYDKVSTSNQKTCTYKLKLIISRVTRTCAVV